MLVYKKRKFEGNLKKQPKSSKQLERHIKGVANYRRIEILCLVADNEGISVEDISDQLDCNFKTISGHIQKLFQAGLIQKNCKRQIVAHKLSPYGQIFYNFLKTFSKQK